MSHLLCYLAGILTVLLAMFGIPVALMIGDWWYEWRRPKPKPGEWMIYSWAGSGSDYSNGGCFTIWRYGTDSSVCWSPPMRTREEAQAECDRRNSG